MRETITSMLDSIYNTHRSGNTLPNTCWNGTTIKGPTGHFCEVGARGETNTLVMCNENLQEPVLNHLIPKTPHGRSRSSRRSPQESRRLRWSDFRAVAACPEKMVIKKVLAQGKFGRILRCIANVSKKITKVDSDR